jgi:LCP family protein required for cell wall assembly
MNETRSDHFKKKKRNRIILLSLLSVALIVFALFWTVYDDIDSTLKTVFEDVETQNMRDKEVSVDATHPISFALLGIDMYGDGIADGGGRSDTIIVATVNPNTKTTTVVSVPRDSYSEMVGYETNLYPEYNDKITHAYAFGGTQMAINSIQEYLNVPIDYYVEINMQGLHDIVEAIGGIELTSPLTFEFEGSSFVEGETVTAGGWDALAFARMRKEDPEGDLGRQNRQRMVIKAILDKLISIDSVTNYKKILKAVEVNIQTNLSFEDLLDIKSGYVDALDTFTQLSIAGDDLYYDGIYYYYTDPEERLRIANTLRDELEIDQVRLSDMNLSDADSSFGYGQMTSAGLITETSDLGSAQDTEE